MKINSRELTAAVKELTACAEKISALESVSLESFIPEETMLVIVDIVNGFVREGAMASPRVEDIIPPTAELLRRCNAEGIFSAALADCHSESCAEFSAFPPHCIRGTSESEVVDEIRSVGGYELVEKNSTNGFHEEKLRRLIDGHEKVNTFIVVGDCTDICVMQLCLSLKTFYTASDRKCRIVIPADCTETYDSPLHSADFANIAAYKLMSDSGIEFVSTIK
ncbi:MAG: cysteine hydrolase family protein [Oscillospiraceae bacterium]